MKNAIQILQTWRVHSIFTDVKLNKKVIKDYQLFMVVGILLAIDLVIMTTWQIADPFYRDTKQIEPLVSVLQQCLSGELVYETFSVLFAAASSIFRRCSYCTRKRILPVQKHYNFYWNHLCIQRSAFGK